MANRYTQGDYVPQIPHLGYKGEVGDLRGDVERAFKRVEDDVDGGMSSVADEIDALKETLGSAMEGDALLSLVSGGGEVSAATLNSAPAGTFEESASISLVNSNDTVHDWANFEPLVTPAYAPVLTGTGGAPTVELDGSPGEDPKFSSGELALNVIFDTDAGATKTYEVGDIVTVTIDVSNISLLSSVALLVISYSVVA